MMRSGNAWLLRRHTPISQGACRAAVLHEAVDWQRAAADAVKGHQVLPPPCSVAQKVEDFLALGKVIDEPMVRRPLLGRGGDPRGP